MTVAIWDYLPPVLFEGPRGAAAAVEFVPFPAHEGADALARGAVDVALLDTLTVLRNTDAYDVFPAVALSSWDFPFARLRLRGGMGARAQSLAYPRDHELESVVARVVLREHYGSEVSATGVSLERPADAADVAEDACLIVAPDSPHWPSERFDMDLGREWYELANYPMVWGLFVAQKGSATNDRIVALRDAVARLDSLRPGRARNIDDEVVRDFVENQVRFRLDDLVVASLTELYNYVYYYGAVDDYVTVSFVALEDPESDEDDEVEMPF